MSARRGLLIDWGGVLTSNIYASFQAFCRKEGLDEGAVADIFRTNPAARDALIEMECGRIDETEFEQRFAQMLQIEGRSEGLVDRLFAGMRTDYAMIGAVGKAHEAGVRTGLISNSWGRDRYDGALLELFDGLVISADEGTRKPDPVMYTRGAERIGLPPAECVYVDDLAFNLTPAEELGMATVLHTSAADTIPKLEELLGMRLT